MVWMNVQWNRNRNISRINRRKRNLMLNGSAVFALSQPRRVHTLASIISGAKVRRSNVFRYIDTLTNISLDNVVYHVVNKSDQCIQQIYDSLKVEK